MKIDTERLRRAAWGKCLVITNYRMRTAPVLTDKQRTRLLAEKSKMADTQGTVIVYRGAIEDVTYSE